MQDQPQEIFLGLYEHMVIHIYKFDFFLTIN